MNLDMDISTMVEKHPLDWLESMFAENQWLFERPSRDELLTSMQGTLTDYHMFFLWRTDIHLLNISCRLDVKYVETRKEALYELVARMNEKLWVGHFEIEHSSSAILLRHGLPLFRSQISSQEQLREIIDVALSECERYYPAFQYVIWGNLKPKEAMEMVLMETVGVA